MSPDRRGPVAPQRCSRSRRRGSRARTAARVDPGGLQRPRRRAARRRGRQNDHRGDRHRRLLRARPRRQRPVVDAGGRDATVRQRDRQDPAAARLRGLRLGGQPSRARRHHPRQGVRPAVHAVPVASRFGFHVDGVGADGDRPRRPGRGAQRAHRRAARVHAGRRGTAAGDRTAHRRRPAPGPAAPPAGGPRTRTREFRRAGHRGAGAGASPTGQATSTTASRSG